MKTIFAGSCSLESNSNYSGSDAGACKTPALVKPDSPLSFRGRKKFSDSYSKTSPVKQNGNINNNAKPPTLKNFYTAQVQQSEK